MKMVSRPGLPSLGDSVDGAVRISSGTALWGERQATCASTGVDAPFRLRALVVPQFFEALAALDFQKFEAKTLLESGNTVVSLNDVAFTVRSTGKSVVEEDEVHIWNFGPDGRVTRFCHKTDTHQHWLAIQGA